MAKPTLTEAPNAPVRASPTFDTDVGNFLGWMKAFVPQLSALIDWIAAQVAAVEAVISTVTTKANEAAASATAAAASVTAAATARDGAQTARVGAESAQAGAESAQTGAQTAESQFKSVWCGSGATAPTATGTGGALVAGCLWFDTGDNSLKAYDGTSWVAGVVYTGGVKAEIVAALAANSDFIAASAAAIPPRRARRAYIGGQ